MQLPILRTLALVAVGNAALAGRDISGFYPGDAIFQFTASLDFLTSRPDGPLVTVAQGPHDWFAKLKKRECRGLRLHNAPMRENKQFGHVDERMLVGMVGGGPRWLIEAVYPGRSELWEGFDRIGDKDAADRKIWLSAYVLIGEGESTENTEVSTRAAAIDLRDALFMTEAVAREIEGAPFADIFVRARDALDGRAPDLAHPPDFLRYAHLQPEAERLLNATGRAWVFGGMGSWNDIAVPPTLQARYDSASKTLFSALQRAVRTVANSTYRA